MNSASSTLRGLAVTSVLALMPAVPAFAASQFTGNFSLGSPAVHNTSGTAGNWSVTIATLGVFSQASVNTQGAPNSLSLFADISGSVASGSHVAPAISPVGQSALAEISMVTPGAGTFSFDVFGTAGSIPGTSLGAIYAFVGSTQYSLIGQSSFSLTLAAGDVFGFAARSENVSLGSTGGRAGLSGLPGLAGSLTGSTLNISNPVFTPVPEASTMYAGLALVGMGTAAWQRSRRRS